MSTSLKKCAFHIGHLAVSFLTNRGSRRGEEIEESRGELVNFVSAQLGLAVHAVDEGDGHLADGEAVLPRPDHHLHLKHVPLRLDLRHTLRQRLLLVQPAEKEKLKEGSAWIGLQQGLPE